MDRYFYSVETDDKGSKFIHLFGNIYDHETNENTYLHAEWTGLYLGLKRVKNMLKNDSFYDYVNERVDYLGDLTVAEMLETCQHYFNNQPGEYLDLKNITHSTPCGDYWFQD